MVTIIGGGPAGLAVARQLKVLGIESRILERGAVGHSWAQHYDSLRLHTSKAISHLPGLRMPRRYPAFPTAAQFRAHLMEYRNHFGLEVRERCEVLAARPASGGWEVVTGSSGTLRTEALIVATGIWSRPVRPNIPGLSSFRGELLHSARYKRPQPHEGRRVLVVGIGNSGAEIASQLGAAGVETTLGIRSGAVFVPRAGSRFRWAGDLFDRLPRGLRRRLVRLVQPDCEALGLPPRPPAAESVYPVVGFALPKAIQRGQVKVRIGIAEVRPETVVFADGREEAFDTIILATGYAPALDFISPQPVLDAQRKLARAQYPHPGLFLAGFNYPPMRGWLETLPLESQRVALAVSEHLADASRACTQKLA